MELIEQVFTIEKRLIGNDSFPIHNPHRLRIMAGDTEVLNKKVPDNKQWRVVISLAIDEMAEGMEE